jgi:hypothetical protein
MIENLRPLTQEQPQGARRNARNAVIRSLGPRPTREQFIHTTISLCWLNCSSVGNSRLKQDQVQCPFVPIKRKKGETCDGSCRALSSAG